MLNQKQFCDRVVRELREIGKQVQSLATDRDLYRKLEADVIAANLQLVTSNSAFIAMMRGAYADATAMRLRRLFAPDANLSLRRILGQFPDYPELLHDKLTGKELADDVAEMDQLGALLKETIDPHFLANERTFAALATVNRLLDRSIDFLMDCVRRYYWIVCDSYIDVDASHPEDPLAIFRFAWIETKEAAKR